MRGSAAALAACALVACSGATPEPEAPARPAAVLAPFRSVAGPRLVIHHDSDHGSSVRPRRIRVWLDGEPIYSLAITSGHPPPAELLFDGYVLEGLHTINVDIVFDARRPGCMGGWYWSKGMLRLRSSHSFTLAARSKGLGLCLVTGDRGPLTAPFERRVGAWFEENQLPTVCTTGFLDRPWSPED